MCVFLVDSKVFGCGFWCVQSVLLCVILSSRCVLLLWVRRMLYVFRCGSRVCWCVFSRGFSVFCVGCVVDAVCVRVFLLSFQSVLVFV